jgi:urease subunit alpha
MVCYHLDSSKVEDVAFAVSHICTKTISAEDILYNRGAIYMISSNSQAKRQVSKVISQTWQMADKIKMQCSSLEKDDYANNMCVKQYLAKYTINPSVTHKMSHLVQDW